jgi:hypothetical protein
MLVDKTQLYLHLRDVNRRHLENSEAVVMLEVQVLQVKNGEEAQFVPVKETLKSEPQTNRSHLDIVFNP